MEHAQYTVVFQVGHVGRSTFSSATASSPSRRLIDRQEARPIFGRRSPMTVDPDELDTFYCVGAGDERETVRLLDQLHLDKSVRLAYVAPQRHLLIGSGGASSPADSNARWREQIRLPEAKRLPQWSGTGNVAVAIVDTGCDSTHPQLQSPALAAFDYFPSGAPYPDLFGHGTHVSGLIFARADSGDVFEGVASSCASLSVHRGMGEPHDASAYYQALRAARAARVINLSLGGLDEDFLETRLLARALRNGSIVVAAMGNHGGGTNGKSYPACLPDVIAVGAVDSDGNRAGFSSSGDHIALCAPGVDIYSTIPTYPIEGVTAVGSPPLAAFSGTSMAAPIVTGVVARMLSWNGKLTRQDVRRHLAGSLGRRWNREIGCGVVDVYATLASL